MWQLIRLTNKKDQELAEQELRNSGMPFWSVSELAEQHHTQPAIVSLLTKTGGRMYLLDGTDKRATDEFLSGHKELFQRVRCRIGKAGHVQMDQEGFDQLIRILQLPESYKVIEVEELPEESRLKEMVIPYGPVKGLQGRFLNTKTPSGKRLFLSVLSLFYMEVRVPIKDVKKNKQELSMEVSYLMDQRAPHWYMLTSTKKEYIERLMGETLNVWQQGDDYDPIVTTLSNEVTSTTLQTTRYLYQAIYYRPGKDGNIEEINLMPHHFFFRTNRYDLETFRGSGFDSHIYVMRKNDGTPIVIPDVQMRIFARFLKERSEATEILYEEYRKGDTARITMGIESNNEIEGTVEIVTKNHYILVSENGFKINVKKGKKK